MVGQEGKESTKGSVLTTMTQATFRGVGGSGGGGIRDGSRLDEPHRKERKKT